MTNAMPTHDEQALIIFARDTLGAQLYIQDDYDSDAVVLVLNYANHHEMAYPWQVVRRKVDCVLLADAISIPALMTSVIGDMHVEYLNARAERGSELRLPPERPGTRKRAVRYTGPTEDEAFRSRSDDYLDAQMYALNAAAQSGVLSGLAPGRVYVDEMISHQTQAQINARFGVSDGTWQPNAQWVLPPAPDWSFALAEAETTPAPEVEELWQCYSCGTLHPSACEPDHCANPNCSNPTLGFSISNLI